MDVAGSIVGFLSLGITCCQGLLNFYESWKDQNETVATTYELVDGLSRTLVILNRTVNDRELTADAVRRVSESITSCESGIKTLQKKLDKIRGNATQNRLRDRFWTEGRKAIYPFRESTLIKLREIVRDVRSNLSLALETLQIDVNASVLEHIKTLGSDVKTATNNIVGVGKSIDMVEKNLDSLQLDYNRDRILNWIFKTDITSNHDAAWRRHEPTTGEWFLNSNEFRVWKESPNSILWVYGSPGSGKTVLSAAVIEELKQHSAITVGSVVAFFYFSFADSSKQKYDTFLSSMIVQLCKGRPIPKCMQELYDSTRPASPSTSGLEMALKTLVKESGDTFIIMDALDECSLESPGRERNDLLTWLKYASRWELPNLHILATSRQEPDISAVLTGSLGAPSVCVQKASHQEDIRLFVIKSIERDRRLRELRRETKDEIETTLVNGSHGMFRWVYCQLEELKKLKPMRARQVRAVLCSLPETLDETYDRLLKGLVGYREEALTMLTWLSFSRRPLCVNELAEACIIQPDSQPQVDEKERFAPSEIIEMLRSLVTTTVRTEPRFGNMVSEQVVEVRLAHFSVQEYLISDRIRRSDASAFAIKADMAHSFIAKSCIAYISFYSNSALKRSTIEDSRQFPLIQYACSGWDSHLTQSTHNERNGLNESVTNLLTSKPLLLDWLQVHLPDQPWSQRFQPREDIGSALYYASYLNLESIVENLLQEGVNVNQQNGHYNSALQAASVRGHITIVKVLLNRAADVNALGGRCGTALQAAASQGHKEIVRLLLANGADINAGGGEYHNSIQATIYCSQSDVFEILIECGADIEIEGKEYGNALQTASWWGRVMAVELLLQKGADVDAQGGEYSTALQAASYRGNVEIVKILLDNGANCNVPGGYYGNALQAAASQGYITIIQLLLASGAHVNAFGGRYGSAINAATYWGHVGTVKVLHETGAQASQDYSDISSGLYSIENGSIEMLSESSISINQKDKFGRTPLIIATRKGNGSAVQILLDFGAHTEDVDDDHKKTALHWAAELGLLPIVTALLEHGATVFVQDKYGETPLHYAAESGHLEIVQILVQKGSDPNAVDSTKRTPLLCAQYRHHTAVVRWLEHQEFNT